jgi:hypothetical protein
MNNSKFLSINWKDAKQLIDDGKLIATHRNYGQIHNQGEYTISADGNRLYKRSLSSPKSQYYLIATV